MGLVITGKSSAAGHGDSSFVISKNDQNPDEYRLGDKLEAEETSAIAQEGGIALPR